MSRHRRKFAKLAQEAQQLTADIQGGEYLPRVRRNLSQIAEVSNRLLSKTSDVVDENTEVKASILLGSHGFDVPRLSQRLESLNAAKTLEPIEPIWETDIEGFLQNERQNTLLSIIEESRKNTFAEVDRHQWTNTEAEWEKEKEQILGSLLGSSQEVLEFPAEAEIVPPDNLSMQQRSTLNPVEMAYARELYKANENSHRELPASLVDMFLEASTKFTDKSVADSWQLVKLLVDVPLLPPQAYQHRSSPELQRGFVKQARSFLEKQYMTYVRDLVYSSLSQAQLGGVPGTFQLVRCYVELKQIKDVSGLEDWTVSGQPVWALIFYCMRCGDLEDAYRIAEQAQGCADFLPYLAEYKDSTIQRLSSSEAKLQMWYKRSVRQSSDPFKKAVFCLIARCDLSNNHPQIIVKTEDYMWLKLCQVQLDPPDGQFQVGSHIDRMTLPDLQKLLLEDYGEDYFSARQHPYLYFQVLMLTAHFEAAVEFLSRLEPLYCHAVHFALALYDLELLHLTPSYHAKLLVKEPNGVYRLNLGRLVVGYTRKFALTDPREALEYFYRLRELKDGSGKNLCVSCVSDLALETREFEMLLGRINPDGSRQAGCIDRLHRNAEEIIDFVAMEAEARGLFEDTVRLYDLAKNHTKVLEILCRLLTGLVSSPCTPHSDRARLQRLTSLIAERYRSSGHTADERLSHTFYLLHDLMIFFDHYHARKIDVALEVIRHLKLLPLSHGESVEQKVAAFRTMDDSIRQCFSDVLLATMSILYSLYKQECVSSPTPQQLQDGGVEMNRQELRVLAGNLITFAGMIPYQLAGDVNARLVQMEVHMS